MWRTQTIEELESMAVNLSPVPYTKNEDHKRAILYLVDNPEVPNSHSIRLIHALQLFDTRRSGRSRQRLSLSNNSNTAYLRETFQVPLSARRENDFIGHGISRLRNAS